MNITCRLLDLLRPCPYFGKLVIGRKTRHMIGKNVQEMERGLKIVGDHHRNLMFEAVAVFKLLRQVIYLSFECHFGDVEPEIPVSQP
ncbi:hypothetical protein D3C87_1845640 [compost metagenome]